jgi:hypothetical protein
MRYKSKSNIIDFFEISIIMPFYKRLNGFKRVLPKNAPFFQRNGIELILVLDEQSEEEALLEYIMQYPFINFKIIIDSKSDEWHNPCKALNVGIKEASFTYVLMLDPEAELVNDVIYKLRYTIAYYPFTFVTGVVAFIDSKDNTDEVVTPNWMPYGSFMVNKNDLIKIHGYNENFEKFGAEYDQIFTRLELFGLKRMDVLDAKTVRREDEFDANIVGYGRANTMPIRYLKNILYPKKVIVNNAEWGQYFSKCIWNWNTHKSYTALKKHVAFFQQSDILNEHICKEEYEIIALIQVRNESKNIPDILQHLEKFCDGIILLDDGSVDDSYEKAIHNKLLMKVKKSYKGYFDDLENRNDLLKIANFFKSKWFFFIDADERFDPRYNNIKHYASKEDVDVYRFCLVDLWDNKKKYRIDIPDNRKESDGIATRARMFRNKGSLQINSDREIHFAAVTYSQKFQVIPLLLLHYGNFDKEIRMRKYDLYISQDPDGKKQTHSYCFLKDKQVVLKPLVQIDLENCRLTQH